jgi:putative restriction endonuclease
MRCLWEHSGSNRAISSVGRAPPLHGGCRRFESVIAHHAKNVVLISLMLSPWRPRGHGGAFAFTTREALHAGVGALYRLSVSLPNFPLEKVSEGDFSSIGQDIFRNALMEYWEGRCPLTGISSPELLRASHMMPWSHCETDGQRLDVHNGLLLSALWDAAFDVGLVTFDDDGQVLLSSHLDMAARDELGNATIRQLVLRNEHRPYLAYHRNQIWKR